MQVTRQYFFLYKHILLSGNFTFLIYCVLLMKDTLSTKESYDKSFNNIFDVNLNEYLNFSIQLLKIYVNQQQRGISFQMIKIGLYKVRILD
jgi:hypothetical protein